MDWLGRATRGGGGGGEHSGESGGAGSTEIAGWVVGRDLVFPQPDFSAAFRRSKGTKEEIIFDLPIYWLGFLHRSLLHNSCEPPNLTHTHFHSPPQHPASPYRFHKLSYIHAIFGPNPSSFSPVPRMFDWPSAWHRGRLGRADGVARSRKVERATFGEGENGQ